VKQQLSESGENKNGELMSVAVRRSRTSLMKMLLSLSSLQLSAVKFNVCESIQYICVCCAATGRAVSTSRLLLSTL